MLTEQVSMISNAFKEKRVHDNFYLKEKTKVKEYYKFIISKVKENLNHKDILDVGCATGDFLRYIKTLYPSSNLNGVEINSKLFNKVKKEEFINKVFKCDILGKNKIGKFDYIFMLGVHSIFDELLPILKKLKSLKKNKKSKIFIFGIWNPYDVDVIVRLKRKNSKILEKGWNVFSLSSLSATLRKIKLKKKVFKFNLKIRILQNKKDPFRSWSHVYNKDFNIISNGSNIIHHFYLIEIV